MSLSDEELQKHFEAGSSKDDSPDARAYRKLFQVLKREPYHLPSDFADQVILRLDTKSSLFNDYFWFGLGLVTFLIAAIIAVLKTDYRFDVGVFKFISGYYGLLLFGVVFILLIHLIDKRVIERRMGT